MGEPRNSDFYDFWISGRVPEPQNQLFLSLETPGYLKKTQENLWDLFKKYYFYTYQHIELHVFGNVGKDGHRKMMKTRLNKSPKSRMWDQYLPENINEFLVMWYQYLPENMNGIVVIWDQYIPENMRWNFGNLGSRKESWRPMFGKCGKPGRGGGITNEIDNFVGPKQSPISIVFTNKKRKSASGILTNLWNPEIEKT